MPDHPVPEERAPHPDDPPAGPGAGDGGYRHRAHDHLVEPVFGALHRTPADRDRPDRDPASPAEAAGSGRPRTATPAEGTPRRGCGAAGLLLAALAWLLVQAWPLFRPGGPA